jgi:hypothetical protein
MAGIMAGVIAIGWWCGSAIVLMESWFVKAAVTTA